MPKRGWHCVTGAEALTALGSTLQGLSLPEAAQRLSQYGPNELTERPRDSFARILWRQFRSALLVMLVAAAGISAALGDYLDAVAIAAILTLNVLLGAHQEYRAEKAMAALRRLAVPSVKVRRQEHVLEISARDLVPGDVALIEAGNRVPADGRLLESFNLRIQESALTGESEPVEKDARVVLEQKCQLGDRLNMVYMGTTATYGRGNVLITATGMDTELGRVAELLETVESEPTPLQQRLNQLGRSLTAAALVVVGFIFVFGILRGEELKLMFMTAVSLAVAAVPEGLPAVVTIALALGAQHMLARRALIRRLPAVETLGSVTVICSDKTGTLTQNRMSASILQVDGQRIDLEIPDQVPAPAFPDAAMLLLSAAALCSDATIKGDLPRNGSSVARSRTYETVGDPTEAALVVAAAGQGYSKKDLEQMLPRIAELPFDSERRRMTTLHRLTDGSLPEWISAACKPGESRQSPEIIAFTKGAAESLLEISTHLWSHGRAVDLDPSSRRELQRNHDSIAQEGMRIVAVGFRLIDAAWKLQSPEQELTLLGFIGLVDPPRPEARHAVETCRRAGIRVVMITGDHPLTARHIAKELGIGAEMEIKTGRDLERLSDQELRRSVEKTAVYARVLPEHKMRIVEALQSRGEIVAMTGDGINDAPALKRADIGIAMGITGTDVAKETSGMVLQDDNFATIVAAIEEGRIIFDNIRKFIKYLLSANSGELWVMFIGPLLGMPLPLLPLQVLWMNLITDGLPALALGLERAESNTMRRPPHPPGEGVFGRGLGAEIAWIGLLMGALSLAVGYRAWLIASPNWQTMVFTTLTFSQMSLALAVRSERDSLFAVGLCSNKALLAAVVLSSMLHLAVVYLPAMQQLFHTKALSVGELSITLIASTIVLGAVEWNKWARAQFQERSNAA
jgi:Ca2+-transporting ATPase